MPVRCHYTYRPCPCVSVCKTPDKTGRRAVPYLNGEAMGARHDMLELKALIPRRLLPGICVMREVQTGCHTAVGSVLVRVEGGKAGVRRGRKASCRM